MEPIHLRTVPPPNETFDHTQFFEFLFSYLKPECYLELGVRDGNNFQRLSRFCKKAIGVDVVSLRIEINDNMEYFQMKTDEYFSSLPESKMFDVVFIDADHSHEQSLKDFLNVKNRIIEDGFVFFHDTYPFDKKLIRPAFCHDVYKTALYVKKNFINDFEIVTLPINPGISILKKISRKKQLIYMEEKGNWFFENFNELKNKIKLK